MKNISPLKTGLPASLLAVLIFIPALCFGQSDAGAVNLEVQLAPSLANAQVIHLADLLNPEGSAKNIYNILIQNQSSQTLRNLYLGTNFKSAADGVLVQSYQVQGQPFDLGPGEQITSFNTNLPRRLADEGGFIEFAGGLTSEGENFSNRLGSLSALPPGRYILQVNLYQGANSQNGGQLIASAEAPIGGNITQNNRDVYLTAPGDVVGADAQIFTPYPQYHWDGAPGTTYRLIVVEAKDEQSPESLIQGARSTGPFINDGAGASSGANGTILDYEIIDARVKGSTFQTPTAGVQHLEPGKTYYWQLFTELRASSSRAARPSEIWSFILSNNQKEFSLEAGSELAVILRKLLGKKKYQQFKKQNPHLLSLEFDGKVYRGAAALDLLIRLKGQVDEDKISFLIE